MGRQSDGELLRRAFNRRSRFCFQWNELISSQYSQLDWWLNNRPLGGLFNRNKDNLIIGEGWETINQFVDAFLTVLVRDSMAI